ncbi:CD209 antigen-like protein E isoform X2 [Crotalus tigris]|uniref:CD209 antigen-like protein E isoform X2 n=1 Tax=Crotalus tigris TaxID=88082 RepID=UPI00192FADF9|nr:CD209 antigen-like protein E isoform X2 [Crotalus tigris]
MIDDKMPHGPFEAFPGPGGSSRHWEACGARRAEDGGCCLGPKEEQLGSQSRLPAESLATPMRKPPGPRRAEGKGGLCEWPRFGLLPTPGLELSPRGSLTPPPPKCYGTSWPCSAIGLLSICVILLLLVTLMNLKVAMLEKRTKEEADLWQWKMLTLTEILKDLQIGKVRNCSVCKVQWMQLSSNCYFFRNRQLSWHSSQTFCQEENADLTMVTNMEEMHFLKFHSFTHYYLDPKTYEYDKFWIGLAYDIVQKRWLWLDGTAFNPNQYGILGDDGCAYIQNESLRSQPCHEVAKSICKTTVQFGWSI